jgi:hypothetical protein
MLVALAGACARPAPKGSALQTDPAPAGSAPVTTAPPSAITQVTETTWRRMADAPIAAPYIRASVWTGRELLILGRVMPQGGDGSDADVAAAYDPATGTWRVLAAGPDREGGYEGDDKVVWTGTEMLVWGITNKAYDPATDRWRPLPDPPSYWGSPAVAVWTGAQMIGWGGGCCGDAVAGGDAYTPSTDSWEELPPAPLSGRQVMTGAWDGKELILAGGSDADGHVFAGAAAYNPVTRSWRRLPSLPEPRTGATATWDGKEILVVGGRGDGNGQGDLYADGVAYDPSTNRWRPLPAMETSRIGHVAVWTGAELLVWGGQSFGDGGFDTPPHGMAYDPGTNAWSPLPKAPLLARIGATAAWTGTAMIVWGGVAVGEDPPRIMADGAAYAPETPATG